MLSSLLSLLCLEIALRLSSSDLDKEDRNITGTLFLALSFAALLSECETVFCFRDPRRSSNKLEHEIKDHEIHQLSLPWLHSQLGLPSSVTQRNELSLPLKSQHAKRKLFCSVFSSINKIVYQVPKSYIFGITVVCFGLLNVTYE